MRCSRTHARPRTVDDRRFSFLIIDLSHCPPAANGVSIIQHNYQRIRDETRFVVVKQLDSRWLDFYTLMRSMCLIRYAYKRWIEYTNVGISFFIIIK